MSSARNQLVKKLQATGLSMIDTAFIYQDVPEQELVYRYRFMIESANGYLDKSPWTRYVRTPKHVALSMVQRKLGMDVGIASFEKKRVSAEEYEHYKEMTV